MATEPIQPISPAAANPKSEHPAGARVARNSKWNILGWLCLLVLGFVSAPIMVRELGADLYGLMALLTSFIAPLGLMDMGIGEATIKYVAESLGRKNSREVEEYLDSTLFFNLLVGVLGAGVMIISASYLVQSVFKIEPHNIPLARDCLFALGAIWCATQVRQTFVGAITALQDYKVVSIGTFLTQAAHTGVGLAVLLAGGGLLWMIRAQAGVAALSVVGWWWLAGRRLPGVKFLPRFRLGVFRCTFNFGFWQMLNNLFSLLVHQAQRWLLGVFLPVTTVGFYNVNNQLVGIVYSAAYRVGQVLFPAVSHMQGEGQTREAGRLVVQFNWMLGSAVVPAYATLAVFAHDLLSLWVGQDFADHGTLALRVMCIGFSVGALFAIPNFFLLGTGRSRWLTLVAIAQGAIAFSVGCLAVPRWGLVGAAAAVACGTIPVYSAILVIIWQRLLRAWVPWPVYLAATFGPVAVALLLLVVLVAVRDALPAWRPGWVGFGLASAGCYSVCWAVVQAINQFLPEGPNRFRSMCGMVEAALGPGLSARIRSLLPRPQPRLQPDPPVQP